MKHIGITGGAGFIGSHITKRFLDEGHKVKISVTNISKSNKYEHLFDLGNEDRLSIKDLDVQDMESLRSFSRDCDIIIHCGTPFKLGVEDPKKDLFQPTINGTENFLKIVTENNDLEKLVFVASVAAFNTSFPFPVEGRDTDHLYTEEDEPFLDEANIPYAQAKYYADQTVRKFIKNNPDLKTEIVTVSPVTVIGRALSKREDSTSVGLQQLIKAKAPTDPFMQHLFEEDVEFALVDVKDVAEGVYRAATKKGLHAKNYFLTSESWKISDISRMLNHEDPDAEARTVYSNELAKKELGLDFKPVSEPLKNFSNP
ncbi:NAD-dependent epimerase/dehydratase family protein [Gramella sp. MT6]|uniref:NAD-dependent epimerase/dehydratase family protein n=1 Tax=Gramella sp. MT6 TaxID=2705471 RepID=UPI001C603019|nr:NAD-dependent epimerase/dehydratase family protein [Gramella sp. MT6]QYA26883.1 NAD-dependent epimerase/dehydratase family protein [Gramella sp. MT6]